MLDADEIEKSKKERSPSFPFISLEKAVERTKALYDSHRREPARVISVAKTWGYGDKSSGLLQTVAALKQFALIEDLGSGPDRKIQITELARRALMDERPGAREAALKEAATNPRLIAEYLHKWVPVRPSDGHCISELELDRGFNAAGAKLFLKVFDETVSFANLASDDGMSSSLSTGSKLDEVKMTSNISVQPAHAGEGLSFFSQIASAAAPLSQRMKIELTEGSLTVSAKLVSVPEIDKLIKILEANKVLLESDTAE